MSSMSRLLVIADDLTGAAEIGGIAAASGYSAAILLDTIAAPLDPPDVLIVDTHSRHRSEQQASQAVAAVASALPVDQFQLVYKKTDSALRGPIAAELSSLLRVMGRRRAVLLPQNPSRGRTIFGGRYCISGIPLHQTPLAADPEHPTTTADAIQLLDSQGRFGIQLCACAQELPASGIVLCDADTPASVASRARRIDPGTLYAGGADFFRALLQSHGGHSAAADAPAPSPHPPHASPPTGGATLMVCGSACETSRRYVHSLHNCGVCALPDSPSAAPASPQQLIDCAAEVLRQLREAGKAVLAIQQPLVPARAAALRQAMAAAVALVLAPPPQLGPPPNLSQLLIEGGATAAAIAQQMGWKLLLVEAELVGGVVTVRVLPGESSPSTRPLTLVLKPGSYPWPTKITSSFTGAML